MSQKAKKSRPSVAARFENASTFYDHLKLALEFHNQPHLLNEHSPLAKPYFLYQRDAEIKLGASDGFADWGATLAACLKQAASALWNGPPLPKDTETLLRGVELEQGTSRRYHYFVLELNYFKDLYRPIPRNQADIYNDVLHIGRSTHDRHLREAVESLGQILLNQLQPTFRLEQPKSSQNTFGREALKAQCLDALMRTQSLSLVGAGGMGKTTLAVALSHAWSLSVGPSANQASHQAPVFWFTIHQNFNDQLSSLLFTLGYFLHQQGASGLWLQLVADEGEIVDTNLVLGLAMADIKAVNRPILLCIDEMEQLYAPNPDVENPAYRQLLTFLENLRGHTPLLFIGQRALIETDQTIEVDKLAQKDVAAWLDALGIAHTSAELEQLDVYTQGNPRLLSLCFALHNMQRVRGEAQLADTLVRLPQTPGLVPVWSRLRRQLSAMERNLLNAIAVFRISSPYDAWQAWEEAISPPSEESSLGRLASLNLLEISTDGAVTLLPTLREIIYAEMAIEQRENFHAVAARICLQRGQFTESAFHLVQADRPAEAVRLWYAEKEREIRRGQVETARPIFEKISANRLKPAQQRQLALIRSSLYQLTGEPDRVIASLEQTTWPAHDELSTKAFLDWSKALGNRGDLVQAHEKLAEGIEQLARMSHRWTQFHVQRSIFYLQDRDMEAARQQALQARLRTELLQAAIEGQMGHYITSRNHCEAALEIAPKIADHAAVGRAHYYLAIAATRQADFDDAFNHYQASLDIYEQIGDQVRTAEVRSNLAMAFVEAGKFQKGIDEANQALSVFEKMNSSYWCSLNTNNIAEAYFQLGDLEQAETYALQTMGYEETHFFPYGLYTMGSVHRQQGELEKAHQLYRQSVQIAEENEDRFLLAYAQRALGEVHIDQGNAQDKATSLLQGALELFQQMDITAEMETTQTILDNLTASQ